jgi:hypothetical protein
MEANRKTTRTRVKREIRRMGTTVEFSPCRGKVLDGGQQEDNQKKGEKGSERWELESHLGRGKVFFGGQQAGHQKKGEEGD